MSSEHISRRDFLKAGAVAAVSGNLLRRANPGPAQRTLRGTGARDTRAAEFAHPPERLVMRSYLCREARRITDAALSEFTSAEAWHRLIAKKREQYAEMMGIEDLPPREQRTPPKYTITGTLQRKGYRIEKLYYESLPQLYVASNLYIPDNLDGPAPAVIYVCGHSATQKVHYQAHPRRWAQLGFVCLIVETVQLGEVRGYHHGCYREGWWHWYSRGYTPAGTELLNAMRGLDLLQSRPEVDGERLGVTGISGGGAMSWWLAAGDERIKVAAPVCGTATLASHIIDRTIDGHCDCMWWINHYLWDLADVGALIAPRPLMIASADRDGIFTIASIREVYTQLKRLYEMLGAGENLALVETPGGHSYHPRSRKAIFSWFIKHLMGKDVPPEEIEDIDESEQAQESEDALRVFVNGPLPEDRTPRIHDERINLAQPPQIGDPESLKAVRREVVDKLLRTTFNHFPKDPPPLSTEICYQFSDGAEGFRFAFTPEEGWRLYGRLAVSKSVNTPAPAVVGLYCQGEGRRPTEMFVNALRAPWVKIMVEPRGTGETTWGSDIQWHLRRACAWTGRTIASMQVYDLLRALQAVRRLPEVHTAKVSLAAREEMCAVALYAALLDGRINVLFLQSPPATQDAPSDPLGAGPAIEMLSCLRVTDLWQVAGLLWPTEIVFVGEPPETYNWAREVYARLGSPGKISVVKSLRDWRPEA